MNKEEWRKRYKARLMERGLRDADAETDTSAAVSNPGFLDDNPEDAADEELSYWASDG